MSEIKCLLKFGKREYMESLVDGNIYCSNATTFWGIEDQLKIKGQGDKLESSMRLFAQEMIMEDLETDKVIKIPFKSNGLIRITSAKKIPVFCMFTVYEEDCKYTEDGNLVINLSDDKKETIREHFPNADSVVVITNPKVFLEDIKKSIGTEIKAEAVHYFNIDKGFVGTSGKTSNDKRIFEYLMKKEVNEKTGQVRYVYFEDDAFKALFCKDVFFEKEQEFRIVLPNDTVESGKSYSVALSTNYEIYDLETFFANDISLIDSETLHVNN